MERPMADKYGMTEPFQCPSCGGFDADPQYPGCWHCNDCGFARCAYTKEQIEELRQRLDEQ